MKNLCSFFVCLTLCQIGLVMAQAVPQPFSKARIPVFPPAGMDLPLAFSLENSQQHSELTEGISTLFQPDSVSFESSPTFGMPFEIDQTQKISYDQQGRRVAIQYYQHHWSGISILGNTRLLYHPNGHLKEYSFLSAIPTTNSFKFKQNFDSFQRLTSLQSYAIINTQDQLTAGDSLQYMSQNNQLMEIIDRKYDAQLQQWRLYQRYSNFQFDPISEHLSAFRMETWVDSLNSWVISGDFKSLKWGFGYEGIHEIAQIFIFRGINQAYPFPSHRATTTPFPSQLVYGLDLGTQFDTLWHYQESRAGGRVIRVDRDVFMGGQRTHYDRMLLDYDGFGLLASEQFQEWTGSQWQGNLSNVSTRNADLNIVSQRDSSFVSALGSMQLSTAYEYVYDSLPSGQISEFTRIATHYVIPHPYARSRFWYNGLSSALPTLSRARLHAYPNPFVSGFWIDETAEGAVLQCFNSAGQLVDEKKLAPGQHWVDGAQLKPGLYLFQLSVQGKLSSKRMLKLP